MTPAQLSQGSKIMDEIRNLERVLEHFVKCQAKDGAEEGKFLVNYIEHCGNVGSGAIRSALCHVMLDAAKKHLIDEIGLLSEKFDKL